jgi:hypothetical protein
MAICVAAPLRSSPPPALRAGPKSPGCGCWGGKSAGTNPAQTRPITAERRCEPLKAVMAAQSRCGTHGRWPETHRERFWCNKSADDPAVIPFIAPRAEGITATRVRNGARDQPTVRGRTSAAKRATRPTPPVTTPSSSSALPCPGLRTCGVAAWYGHGAELLSGCGDGGALSVLCGLASPLNGLELIPRPDARPVRVGS